MFFVVGLDYCFDCDVVGCCAGGDVDWMVDCVVVELQDHVFIEVVEQLVYLVGVDVVGGDWYDGGY